MKSLLLLIVLFLTVLAQPTELNLPVRPDTQEKLSFSLQRLAEELEYFRTPFENKTNLYKRVAQVEQYLQEVTLQVSDYENTIRGRANIIGGKNNVVVGSFNTLRGSNNYVFIEKYKGQANGDLLIGRWRIEIEKKTLILINSGFAISFINEETNRRYLRYLTDSRKFRIGSSLGSSMVTVVKEDGDSGSGFSFGSTVQGPIGQNTNSNGLSIGRNIAQQTATPMRPQTVLPSQTGTPAGPVVIPTTTVISTRQTIINPTTQTVQQLNPVTSPSQPIRANTPNTITTAQMTSSDQLSVNRRTSMQHTVSARSLLLSTAQSQPTSPQILAGSNQLAQNNQARQVTNMFTSNRLQLGSTLTSNLRTESQTQAQSDNQSVNISPNLSSAQQQDQRMSLGPRLSRPEGQSGVTLSAASTQQRISSAPVTPPRQTTQPAPINLASWRNRS